MWLFVSFLFLLCCKDLTIRNVDVLKVPEAGVEPAPSYEDMTLNHIGHVISRNNILCKPPINS
jgi:hypothetical protein